MVLIGILFPDVSLLRSAPLVVGYERFHGEDPGIDGGAILFSELGCAGCHGGSDVVVPRQGPGLTDLSSRVDRQWVLEFLKSPGSAREGSTMPSMIHGLTEAEIDAVMAYLGSLGKGLKHRAERHANAERGSALYHEKGCIACHVPTDDYRGPRARGDQFESSIAVALPDLAEKTSLAALHHFLMQPSAYRSDGRMPHFPLDRQEALDIAAHLLDFRSSDPRQAENLKAWPKANAGQIAEGKSLVQKQNCAACHTLPGLEPSPLIPLDGQAKPAGCLGGERKPGLPFYELTEKQVESLLLFLSRDEKDSHEDLTFAAMNCAACHQRDEVGGATSETDPYFIGVESLGDSGRLPPPLTGIGHKLLPQSMKQVFAGLGESRVRPYLKTKMPVYGQHAMTLTDWLQRTDAKGEGKRDPLAVEVSPEIVESGRKLVGTHGGMNCITCHDWAGKRSLGIPALNISNLNERIRYDWFRDYLLDPPSYRPGTLMPPLWPDGKSSVPNVMNGNTDKQIEAVWAFIGKGEGFPDGFPDRSNGQFELLPKEKPIIQRTFFNKTGTKAILAGFPGGVHLAFDGSTGIPSLLWRGPFFDAYDTWFTRAAPFGDPLSDEVYEFEGGETNRRFLGYQIDEKGNPTFIIMEGNRKIMEGFHVENGTMLRTLRWEKGAEPSVGHPKGVEKSTRSKDGVLEIQYSWE